MRILQICSARDIGGGERHVADLSNALSQRGHDVFVAANPKALFIAELQQVPSERVFEVPMRGSADPLAIRKIAKIVRENEIDVIHAHVARDYPLAALASRRADNTPFVLTRHVLFPLNKLHRLLLRRASKVIAVSNAVAASLRRRKIFAAEKIVTIHNGIDVERYRVKNSSPAALTALDGKQAVGTIGHIALIKGHADLVRAFALLAGERNDVDLVIVGEDRSRDGSNRENLEHLISDLNLQKRVHLIGWQDDIAPLLHGFGVFVSAARSEPFGLVILEAMAAGVPVVATASEGALEIIDDGATGVLVQLGDTAQMAMAIGGLLDDRPKCESLTAKAFDVVAGKFSLAKMVEATEFVYQDVIRR